MKKIIAVMTVMILCFSLFAVPADSQITRAAESLNVNESDLKAWVLSHQVKAVEEEAAVVPAASEGLIFEEYEGEYWVTGASDDPIGDLVIPAEHDGLPVAGVNEYAFEFRDDITSLTLEEGVYSLGESSFEGCSNLKKIVLPQSFRSAGDAVFYQVYEPDVYWTASVVAVNKEFIPGRFDKSARVHMYLTGSCVEDFSNIASLTSVELSDNVTRIEDGAFSGCTNLEELIIPETVTYIGVRALAECSSLKSIWIPSSVQELKRSTFMGCTSLESVNIPETSTRIPERLFFGCSSLKEINIPEGVTSIEDSAFYKCASLTGVKLPASLQVLGESVFRGCASIKAIEIPSSCRELGNYVFAESGIEVFTLPSWMKVIPDDMFYKCESLKTVNFNRRISTIGASAFKGCVSLQKIYLPDSIRSIGYGAFDGCKRLHELYLPEGLEDIQAYAFKSCALSKVFIPKTVSYVGNEAFYGNYETFTVSLESGVDMSGWKMDWNILKNIGYSYVEYVDVLYNQTR